MSKYTVLNIIAFALSCVLAGCTENGTVLDPFAGSGTVGEVCNKLNRNSILIELNSDYVNLIKGRVAHV